MYKPSGYQIFLMIELARLNGVISSGIEFDTTWDLGEKLHVAFQNSEFNDFREPEIECIENFLKNK